MSNDELRKHWEAYAAIWKLEGAEAKRAACAEHLDPACVYTGPLTRREGFEPLIESMVEFDQQVPGGHVVTTGFRSHNRRSVATWNMVGSDGAVLGDGISYGEYASNRHRRGVREPGGVRARVQRRRLA